MQSLLSSYPISDKAYPLALQACAQALQSLGLSHKRELSAADIPALRWKAEERVVKLRDQIPDPAKRPTLAALRQAIKECILFPEGCPAADRDAAWFSKHRDRRFRARAALPHESLPHHRNAYRSIAIVCRELDGGAGYHPVLECAVHVDHIVDWKNDSEIAQVIDLSGRKDAPLH